MANDEAVMAAPAERMRALGTAKSETSRSSSGRRGLKLEQERLWLFLVPSGVLMTCVLLFPLGYAFYLSFFDHNISENTHSFVGLGNYSTLLQEDRLFQAFLQTVFIVGVSVAIEFCLGLAVAYGLYRLVRGAKPLTVIMFLPHVITPVVAALFLRWIFVARWGLLDGVLISLGIFPPDWLGDPMWARVAVIAADVWQFTPFLVLVLYAALNTVDHSMIEAAQIDGARSWQLLFRIMLPAIRPIIVFVLAIRIMDGFRTFDAIYVLTAGGPGTATETITMYTYILGFRLFDVGKASALGVLTLLLVAAIVACVMRLVGGKQKKSV
jgi:multiple sugar transport system permease protein